MNKILPLSLITIAWLSACSTAAPPASWRYSVPEQPEAASGTTEKPGWAYARQAVAAANPLATDAGHQILQAGGSALDAAIAVQMVLGLVEPQSSGIAGGAFLLHFDGHQVLAHDGRETAPANARSDMLLGEDGKPLPFDDAVLSGRSVGVPGAVRMLEAAHRQHGQLPWAQLFEPAIRLAELGFKDMTRTAWLGLWAVPGHPDAALKRIREETLKALATPAVRDRLMAVGLNVNAQNPPTPEQMVKSLHDDYESVGAMLKAVNYKPE